MEHKIPIFNLKSKFCRFLLVELRKLTSGMDNSNVTPLKFKIEDMSTSTPKENRDIVGDTSCGSPRMLDIIMDGIEDIRTVKEIRNETVNIEFESESSSMIEHIVQIMNETGKSLVVHWEGPDPNLEDSIIEVLEGVVVQTSLELEEHLGWRLSMFDRIGGTPTLREVWLRLKSLKQVMRVKRKLSENSSSSSDLSVEEQTELREFIESSRLVEPSRVREWISDACSLLERMNINVPSQSLDEFIDDFIGPKHDMVAQVGSEPDMESLREVEEQDESPQLIVLADGMEQL